TRRAKKSQGSTPVQASAAPSGNSSRYGSRRSTRQACRVAAPCATTSAPGTAAASAGEHEVEELGAAGDAQLRIDLRQVLLDGLLAVAHHRADLRRGEALEDQAGHLLLFLRQPRARESAVDETREVDVHRRDLLQHLPQRLGGERLLEQVGSAGVERRL